MSETHAELEPTSVDLKGKVEQFGPVHIIRAEWRGRTPRLVVLRYWIDGRAREEPLGVRLDLDKRAVLDTIDDVKDADHVNRAIRSHAADIGHVIVTEWRARAMAAAGSRYRS